MLRTITIDTEKIAKLMVDSTVRYLSLSEDDKQKIIKDIKVDLYELPDSDFECIINKEFTERGKKLGGSLAIAEILLNDGLGG